MKVKDKFGNLYLVGILFLELAVFATMIWNAKRLSEMVYFLMMGVVFIIPCLKEMIKKPNISDFKDPKLYSVLDKPKTGAKTTTETKNELQEYKFKKKTCKTKGYEEFNNLLRSSVQNKLMDRDCILKLKCELRYRLGTHIECYNHFKFQNDMHEIYTLSKSSALKEEDYTYLIEFLSNSLDLSNAQEVE